jgi:predicted enzyme related to lactoylglutathione lyase
MMNPNAGPPSHWLAYFSVTDTDAAVAAAVAGGGSLQGEPMNSPFGRMAFLTDPDGAVFALAGPPPTR